MIPKMETLIPFPTFYELEVFTRVVDSELRSSVLSVSALFIKIKIDFTCNRLYLP